MRDKTVWTENILDGQHANRRSLFAALRIPILALRTPAVGLSLLLDQRLADPCMSIDGNRRTSRTQPLLFEPLFELDDLLSAARFFRFAARAACHVARVYRAKAGTPAHQNSAQR